MIDGYTPIIPKIDFDVSEIFSVHYFEYNKDYTFPGEKHDFWEFCYVDRGEINVIAGDREIVLRQPEIIFHKPNEWHSLEANKSIAPNLVVASFKCAGPYMDWFNERILQIGDAERLYLAKILDEASNAFVTPLNDPETSFFHRNAKADIGCEQMLKIHLELLLISLYRRYNRPNIQNDRPTSMIKEKSLNATVDKVVDYLEININRKLTLEEICRDNLVGRSYLQKIFREKTGGGVIEYFGKLKIETAKHMIREGKGNFTEISAFLGYNSIHYFSRHFKKVCGMTPSEYSLSVKVLTDKHKLD